MSALKINFATINSNISQKEKLDVLHIYEFILQNQNNRIWLLSFTSLQVFKWNTIRSFPCFIAVQTVNQATKAAAADGLQTTSPR